MTLSAEPPDAALPGEVCVTHDYYGVPAWLMRDYLTDLGARVQAEGAADVTPLLGDGWRAWVRKAPVKRIGALAVGGATVTFAGPQATLDELFPKLHRKTWRGGG